MNSESSKLGYSLVWKGIAELEEGREAGVLIQRPHRLGHFITERVVQHSGTRRHDGSFVSRSMDLASGAFLFIRLRVPYVEDWSRSIQISLYILWGLIGIDGAGVKRRVC